MNKEDRSGWKGARVLVTGGTGFTGSYVLRDLAEKGADIRAIARQSSHIEPFQDLEIKWYRGDVFDPELIKEAVSGVEYIFHIAAAFREAKVGDDYYSKVHVESTRLLAEAAIKEQGFKRFIHTSTVGVHSHIANPPADEEYPFNPDDLYQKTKAEAELWIRAFSKEKKLPLTVIRPAAIYGPGDRRLLKLFKFAKKGMCPLIAKHNTLYHLIHVEDLAAFHLFCAQEKKTLGEVFICGNEKPSSLMEIVGFVAKKMKKQVRYISLPKTPIFLLADLSEFLFKPFGIEPPIYRRRMAFFTKDRCFNTSKMQRTGFHTKWSNEEGLAETLKWYQKEGWI